MRPRLHLLFVALLIPLAAASPARADSDTPGTGGSDGELSTEELQSLGEHPDEPEDFDENITGNECVDHPDSCPHGGEAGGEERGGGGGGGGGSPPSGKQLAAWQLKADQSGSPRDLDRAGRGYLKAGDLEKALKDFAKALQKNPQDVKALTGSAQVKLLKGDTAGAKADARAVLTIQPGNRIAMIIAGHDSISNLGDKLNAKPKPSPAGDSSAAPPPPQKAAPAPAAKQASATAPPQAPSAAAARSVPVVAAAPVSALVRQAQDRIYARDPAGALIAAKQAVDQDPKSAEAWATLAQASNGVRENAAAVKAADTALALQPDNAQALRAKAYAELQMGDFEAALRDAQRAVQLDPANGLGVLYLAMAEEKLGRRIDALKHFEQASGLDSTLAPLTREAQSRLGSTPFAAAPSAAPAAKEFGTARQIGLCVSVLAVLAGLFFAMRPRADG